jgi:hypothetical protein
MIEVKAAANAKRQQYSAEEWLCKSMLGGANERIAKTCIPTHILSNLIQCFSTKK